MSDLTKMPLFYLLPKISQDRIRAEQEARKSKMIVRPVVLRRGGRNIHKGKKV